MNLDKKSCVACTTDLPALAREECLNLLKQVNDWHLEGGKKITKRYRFKDFMSSMNLANQIAAVAEEENHHPDLLVRWGELRVEIWTHKVDGLTENDFILAAKIDALKTS